MRLLALLLMIPVLVSCASAPPSGADSELDSGPAPEAGSEIAEGSSLESLPPPPPVDSASPSSQSADAAQVDALLGEAPTAASGSPAGALESAAEQVAETQPAPGEVPAAHCDPVSSKEPGLYPEISSVSPRKFTALGGRALKITGSYFEVGARVFIGSMECGDVAVQDPENITCVVPPFPGGVLGVVVANPRRQCVAAQETIKYIPLVDISPRTKALVVNGSATFTASGGTAPYKYTVAAGSGTIDAATGVYTAPAQPTTAMIRVTDSEGITSDAISIAQPELVVALKEGDGKDQFEFNVTGGLPPLRYSIEPRDSGTDEAGNSVGSSLITVTDGTGIAKTVTLKIHRGLPLSLFAQSPQVAPGGKTNLIAAGGNGGYAFAITSGSGTLDPQTGSFVAPKEPGTTSVRVTDAKGLTMETSVTTLTPAAVIEKGINVIGVSAGFGHTCWTGKGGLKCWGDNRHGELGNGTMVRQGHPTDVKGVVTHPLQVVSGYSHTCALLEGGRMKCWGDNRYGQLGDGSQVNSITPVQVSGMLGGVIQIAAGQYHTCAVLSGGAVKCWGSNRRGQLGNDQVKPSALPVQVQGLEKGVIHVAAGAAHTCAVIEGGGVKCWGYNTTGQLGDGSLSDRLVPSDVAGIASGASMVALGGYHSCAVMAAGGMKCWGNNGLGQLGNTTLVNSQVPKDVVRLAGAIRAVSAGFYHTCALMAAGSPVLCWGYNRDGQLGDGSNSVKIPMPVSVKNLGSDVQAIAAGVDHTCALVDQGVRCWGGNNLGQFGNRSQLGSRIPSRVVSLETEAVPGASPPTTQIH